MFFIIYCILIILFLLLLFANYMLGVFRLSANTNRSIFVTCILSIFLFYEGFNDSIHLLLMILFILSICVFIYCIKNEKSTDFEKFMFDVSLAMKTGQMPIATDSSLLSEEEKMKIDESLEKKFNKETTKKDVD